MAISTACAGETGVSIAAKPCQVTSPSRAVPGTTTTYSNDFAARDWLLLPGQARSRRPAAGTARFADRGANTNEGEKAALPDCARKLCSD